MTYSVNVRTVAEFALEGGDLAMDFSAVERMREGMEGHLRLQRELDSTWRAEEPVACEIECAGIRLRVQGRADAVRRHEGRLTVEEIKTTRQDVCAMDGEGCAAHWAQAEMYAAIICMNEGYSMAEVALVYMNVSGAKARIGREYTADRLREMFLVMPSRMPAGSAPLRYGAENFSRPWRSWAFPLKITGTVSAGWRRTHMWRRGITGGS